MYISPRSFDKQLQHVIATHMHEGNTGQGGGMQPLMALETLRGGCATRQRLRITKKSIDGTTGTQQPGR